VSPGGALVTTQAVPGPGGTAPAGPATHAPVIGGTRTTAASSVAPAPGKQDTTPVVLCQDGSFTGQAGPPFSGGQPGLAAWVRWTNAHGGLAGHPVTVDSKDDQQDNNKALQNVQNCVQNEHAAALIASFMPVTADAVGSYVQQHKIAVIGGDAVTRLWFQNPYFFPQSDPSPSDAYGGVAAWKAAGKKAGAVIYCAELGDCTNTANRVREAAAKAGIAMKGSYQVSIANPSYTSQCGDMKSNGVDAVYVNVDGPSLQRLARDCNAVGYHPLYTTGGLALDANAVIDDKNLDGTTVAVSVFPWMTAATQAAKDFQTAMATYAPDVTPSESAAISWTSGQMLVEAIAKVGAAARSGPITSAMIIQGLDMIRDDTLGGLTMGKLTFLPGKPAAEHYCWGLAALVGGQWTAPQGASYACAT
jgi:branched-chain amino acid transport system substrate-binding protein